MVLRGREARDETIAVDGSFARSSEKLRACIALIGRHNQENLPLPVPLALHCVELAALEAICRKLTT
jgi:hypothetical protein